MARVDKTKVKAPTRYPLHGAITQPYGVDWKENPEKTHTGVDIAARRGSVVPSMNSGTVAYISNMGTKWGKGVVIESPNGAAKAYLHVNPSVSLGEEVSAGQRIGTVWRDHLHFNVCKQVRFCHRGALPTSRPDPDYPGDPLFRDGPFISP